MWIQQRDQELLTDLFEIDQSQYNKVINGRQKKDVAEGISIQYLSHYTCDSVDIPTWAIIAIEIGEKVILPVSVSILAKYLYDKLKDRKDSKVVINNQQVEINAETIEQVILTNVNIYLNQQGKEPENKTQNENGRDKT